MGSIEDKLRAAGFPVYQHEAYLAATDLLRAMSLDVKAAHEILDQVYSDMSGEGLNGNGTGLKKGADNGPTKVARPSQALEGQIQGALNGHGHPALQTQNEATDGLEENEEGLMTAAEGPFGVCPPQPANGAGQSIFVPRKGQMSSASTVTQNGRDHWAAANKGQIHRVPSVPPAGPSAKQLASDKAVSVTIAKTVFETTHLLGSRGTWADVTGRDVGALRSDGYLADEIWNLITSRTHLRDLDKPVSQLMTADEFRECKKRADAKIIAKAA